MVPPPDWASASEVSVRSLRTAFRLEPCLAV